MNYRQTTGERRSDTEQTICDVEKVHFCGSKTNDNQQTAHPSYIEITPDGDSNDDLPF